MKLSNVVALSALGMASFASADRVVPGRTLQKNNNKKANDARRLKEDKNKDKNKDKDKNGGGGGDAGGEAGGVALPGCESGTGTCYAKNQCDGGATLVPIWLCMDACFMTAEDIPFVYVLGGVTPAEGCNPGSFTLPGGNRKLRQPSSPKKAMARIVAPDNNRQFTNQEITISNEKIIPNPLK